MNNQNCIVLYCNDHCSTLQKIHYKYGRRYMSNLLALLYRTDILQYSILCAVTGKCTVQCSINTVNLVLVQSQVHVRLIADSTVQVRCKYFTVQIQYSINTLKYSTIAVTGTCTFQYCINIVTNAVQYSFSAVTEKCITEA